MIYLAMYTMPLEDLRALRRHLRHLWVHHPVNRPEVYEPLYALFMATGTVMDARYMPTVLDRNPATSLPGFLFYCQKNGSGSSH